jgi:predicted transcriptional regulator
LLEIWPTKARRSDVQIMAEILVASRFTELGRPEISSTVNISYMQAQRYLKRLSDLRLVDAEVKEDNHVCYRTNEKGNRLLIQVESIQELLQRRKPAKLSL